MKIVLFFLILLNALFFGWSSWIAKTPLDMAVVTPEPDAPALVLFEEKFPERAQAEREALEKIARDKRLAERAQREAEEEAARLVRQQEAEVLAQKLAAEQAAADEAARVAQEQADREAAERLAAQQLADEEESVRLAAIARQEQADRDEAARVAAEQEAARLAAVAAQEQAAREEAERVAAQAKAQADAQEQAELAAAQAAASETVEVAATNPPTATRSEALAALNDLAATPTVAAVTDGPQVVTLDGPQEARCVMLGPFVQLRDAARATALLRDFEIEAAQRTEESQIWVGHWVHLPPAASRAAAVETVEKLRADGVSDIYIEPSGELRHAISLGLFSDASRAEIRAGKIRTLGITPQIRDRFRDGSVYWLDLDLAPGQNVDPTLFEAPAGREIKLRPRDCEGQTQAG